MVPAIRQTMTVNFGHRHPAYHNASDTAAATPLAKHANTLPTAARGNATTAAAGASEAALRHSDRVDKIPRYTRQRFFSHVQFGEFLIWLCAVCTQVHNQSRLAV